MLAAGRLKDRITLQRLTVARDSRGQDVETWADVATVWAQVQQLAATEAAGASQVKAKASWQVNIRYRADLTSRDHIIYGGHVLAILSVVDKYQQHEELELICSEELP